MSRGTVTAANVTGYRDGSHGRTRRNVTEYRDRTPIAADAVGHEFSDFTGRGNLKKLMQIAAGAAMALAIAALPVAAQAKTGAAPGGAGQTAAGAAGTQTGAAAGAVLNENELLIPDNGRAGATPAGTGQPAGAPSASAQPPATPGVSTWDFVRMLLILGAVIAAIYVVFWLLRRGAGKRITENDLIRVLGSRSLAGNRSLHIVEVGTSVFLVGASDGGVQLISEITDKESLDSVRIRAAEEGPAGRRTFQQILAEIFRPAKQGLSLGEGLGFLRGQREKLRKL